MNWTNKGFIFCIGILFILTMGFQGFGQKSIVLSPQDYNGLSWDSFVKKISKTHQVRFFYEEPLPEVRQIIVSDTIALINFLEKTFENHRLYISTDKKGNYFFTKNSPLKVGLPPGFFEEETQTAPKSGTNKTDLNTYLKTNDDYTKRTIIIGTSKKAKKGKKCVISGYVKSAENGDPIIACTIYIKNLGIGAVTSEKGYYSLTVPRGIHVLTASSIEQKEKKLTIDVRSEGNLNIVLEKGLISLDEIVIKGDRYDNVKSTNMGLERLEMKQVKGIPQILGETDLMKIALMLPGVQNTGEASSGFNVRGSPSDQTQFFINNVPIYNTSHLFGFFSAFNPDAVEEFKLYKSNIPVEYGGRLASVFDVSTTQGNRKKFSASGGISPVTGRIFLETPIQKDRSSAYIGVRSTYSDWLLGKVKSPDIRNSSANFYDAVGGVSYELDTDNELELFGYYSHDDISFASLAEYKYENIGGSLNWNHSLGSKSKFTLSTIYSNYWFDESNHEIALNAYQHKFNITNYKLKGVVDYIPNNNHKITTGFSSTFYSIDRGTHKPLSDESLILTQNLGSEFSLENAVFISNEWKILPFFTVYGGLRFNNYNFLGPQDVFEYQENKPMDETTIMDTLNFGAGDFIKTYNSLDFRIAANYMLTTFLSFKASVNSLHQNIFMLSNTISISPTAKWKMADYHIKPLEGYQYSFGVYSNPDATSLELSAEAYYKQVSNLVEFKNGANMMITEIPETEVVQGNLNAYGIELMVRKKAGRLNGWVNYTYSKSTAQVNSPFVENQINYGEAYPTNFDKPHAFNLVFNYKFNRRYSISSNVVYNTGKPVTYPVGIYYQDGRRIINFSGRNEYRLPDYFRVDLSINIEGNLLSEKFAHGSWSLSVYNVFGRKNAYSVYFKNEEDRIQAYKLSVFGSPIVTLTYNFKLGNYAD